MAGIAYLGLIGAALTYVLWFRGVARLEPAVVSSLAFSPVTAVLLVGACWARASAAQLVGMAVVVASVWLSQRAQRMAPAPATPRAGLRPHVHR